MPFAKPNDQGVVNFFRFHRGHTFASSALMEPINNAFIADVERFIKRYRVPLITFHKGERKEDIVLPRVTKGSGHLTPFCFPLSLPLE